MSTRILVVEDERDIQQFVAEALKDAGYQVTVPVDSYVALELALDRPYGLITLDIQMPLLDGEGFIRTLRAHGVHTPILLLADSLGDRQRRQFETLGGVDFVVKPFRAEHLVQAVHRHLPLSTE